MKTISGGITAPLGFKAAGIAAGIKRSGNLDLAMIFSRSPAGAAGMFTSNKVKAAPVNLSIEHLKKGKAQAIVANAGNANACNGASGMVAADKMANRAAKLLKIKKESVLVASTGTIGVPFPTEKVLKGIDILAKKLSKEGGENAARAIMTTDTRKKEIAVAVNIGGKAVKIGAIAKGSGMICPNMKSYSKPHATMFCFITTDANIKLPALTKALGGAISDSFNMVTIDNDQSTNDTAFILANGMSCAKEIKASGKDFRVFSEALNYVCIFLAKEMARDGEGATKLLEVRVDKAKTLQDARLGAKVVAGSNLLKSAIFGADPNWGRVMAAIGYSGASLDPDKVDVSICGMKVVKSGHGLSFNKEALRKHFSGREVVISIDLNLGRYGAVAWGCDLSYDYVKINAEYHT